MKSYASSEKVLLYYERKQISQFKLSKIQEPIEMDSPVRSTALVLLKPTSLQPKLETH